MQQLLILFRSFAISWVVLSLFCICVVLGIRQGGGDSESAGPLSLVGFLYLVNIHVCQLSFPGPPSQKGCGSFFVLTAVHAAGTALSPRLNATSLLPCSAAGTPFQSLSASVLSPPAAAFPSCPSFVGIFCDRRRGCWKRFSLS